MGGIVASAFLKVFNKIALYDKTLDIHVQGADNAYPDIIESVVSESVTASTCVSTITSYIAGKGFGEDYNKTIVNEDKNKTLRDFETEAAESLALHKGVFIHVNYNINLDYKSIDVLPYSDCRIGKKDSNDYNGKILVCKDWSSRKAFKNAKKIDVFNNNKDVIRKQIENAGGLANYDGQVLFIKKGRYTYPLAPIHPALKDAQSESQVAIYKKTSLCKGFFGKTLIITKPLVDSDEDHDSEDYRKQVAKRNSFRQTIKSFIGVENSDGVLHLEMEFESESIEDEIMFKQIDTNIDDKLFEHTEKSVSENICVAFGVHPNLIRPKDGAMFSSGGEIFKQMKLDCQDKTSDSRSMLEETIAMLMRNFKTPIDNLKIIPLIEEEEDANNQTGHSQI